ncbi:WD-40 repeat-containing protein [Nitzschia inconspicua]|uniref:WD-40 repeat-containing protein n=1 Tax=Nitzschia inconspicua TaxID=303405 RepID=A0A9K3M099_9STRA|nr:WD-40 repeat-containing protein [Nitzschia inconspicua]KAG7370461.1 WD-40 repeat-containing protein [Nitzschia inconspicua]
MSRLRQRKQKIDTTSLQKSSSSSFTSKRQKTIDFGEDDPNIDSDHEDDDDNSDGRHKHDLGDDNDSLEEEETLDAKKVRLAREYLRKLEANEDDDSDSGSDDDDDDDDENCDSDDPRDRIGVKLQRERLQREGTYEQLVADKVQASVHAIQQSIRSNPILSTKEMDEAKQWIETGHIKVLRGHDLTPTCVALQANGERAISGSKDHSVILWDIQEERRAFTLCPTFSKTNESSLSRTMGQVLSVACSDDGRYAAVGRRDATVSIYDVRVANNTTSTVVKTFTGHKGPITSLCFRTQSLQLFSASDDRCLRQYHLNELLQLETLYGHQFGVTAVDCHTKERPVSVGRDRTARAWKIADDTHLIFRAGAKVASADCVRILKEDWFVTGHEDGYMGLWRTDKKRAVASIQQAHGTHPNSVVPRGITALGSLRGSDMVVTGSCDGHLRLWKVMMGQTLDSRSIEPMETIPLSGYVNGIAVGPKARFCVVAVGQEPKMGRFDRVAGAKNRFGIVRLRPDDENGQNDDDDGDLVHSIAQLHRSSHSEGSSSSSSDED